MKKAILLALLAVAVVAVPASASVQNVKVSGSIDSTYIYRDNFDLGREAVAVSTATQFEDTHQSDLITQATLRVDADLTDQVSTTIQLINERVWEQDSGTTNSGVDLNLAFVTLREMLYSPLTVIVGRQAFHYGNSLVVDSSGTNNSAPADSGINNVADDLTKQTAQDAVRLVFDYNPLTLELLYSKIDTGTAGATLDHVTDDINLYGINGNYELGDSMNSVVEAYFFSRIDQSPEANTGGATKSDTTYVPGFRVSTSPIEGLNVQTELAWQRGNNVSSSTTKRDNEKREAMAAQFIANYQVPVLEEYKPVAQYVFTHLSGDSNPNDRASTGTDALQSSTNKDTAWDPMYENQSGGKIYNTLFNYSNANIHEVSLQANPVEDVTTKVTWTGLWLDKKIDAGNGTLALLQPNATAATGNLDVDTGNKELGYEVDVDAIYDYTEDVQIGASLGWYIPGDVFMANNDSVASQAIVHGNVNF